MLNTLFFAGAQINKLHTVLKPFLLRRIKSDVEDSLPAKQEILLYAGMTKQQKKINQQLCDRSFIVSSLPGTLSERV
jgi:ATP-dependent DNA helicase